MPASELLFLHPLLGTDDAWSAYLVESPPGTDAAVPLGRLFAHAKLREFDQRHVWLTPANPATSSNCKLANVIHVFPPLIDEPLAALEADLRKQKRKLALVATPEEKLPMTGTWDYVLVGTSHARSLRPFSLHGLSSRTIVAAHSVLSPADRAWLLENACSLSTTEFLMSRDQQGKKADLTRVKLLEMLALIAEDADTEAIEEVFKQEPKLSYSLLRLVNSAAIAPRTPITSFSQAINLLGRRQLQRWLQLLVYADPNNGHRPNPLLQKAAARGRLLENLVPHLSPRPNVDNIQDAAFMVGVFSLLDVLLNMSMPEILQQLPLTEPVRIALSEYGGAMGGALRAIEAGENRDLDTAARQIALTGIAPDLHLDAQLDALAWAAKIHSAA